MTTSTNKLRFDGFQKCFVRGQQRISGLLPLLAKRFYPNYSYTKAIFNRPQSDETEYQQRQRKKQSRTRATGIDMGMLVDREIAKTVDILTRVQDLPMSAFFSPKSVKEANMPTWAKDMCKHMLIQTRAFWKEMDRLQIRPIQAQLPVGAEADRYATAVDVVCRNEVGEIIIIEVKCGFTGYYSCCTNKHMKAPLQRQTDSLANQHQIQLAATVELYKHAHPEEIINTCFILHIQENKVSCYPLKPWAKNIPSWSELLFVNPK